MTRARLASVAGGLLLLVMAASAVHAANEVPTRLTIRPIEPITVGVQVSVVVSLTLDNGDPVVNERITLTVDGADPRTLRTDDTGVVTFRLGKDLPPGTYALLATYAGETDVYLGASADATLSIVPFELAIETVPPLPGMVFELDGTPFVAGDDGIARITVQDAGGYELVAIDAQYEHPDQRAEFSRWNIEEFSPSLLVQIPYRNSNSLQAGFDVSYRASQTFVDKEGGTVDPSRITSLTFRNSLGTTFTYPDGGERWYKASRVVRRPIGLQSVPVHYTLDAVMVDGANVVTSGRERFDISPNDSWKIELLLFSARMLPNDALFGFPIGDAVTVTYPDGRVVRIEAEADGELWARWLARGQYRVTVADAPGWAPVMPVALSRDQEVELRVISYLDMAVAVFSAVGLAVGLLHIGRPHLVPRAVVAAGGSVKTLMSRPRRGVAVAPVKQMARPITPPVAANPGRASAPPAAARPMTPPVAANPDQASAPPVAPPERVPLLPSLLPVQTVVVRAANPSLATAVPIVPPVSAAPATETPVPAAEPSGAITSLTKSRSKLPPGSEGTNKHGAQRRAAGQAPTRNRRKTVATGEGEPPVVSSAPELVRDSSGGAQEPTTAAKAARTATKRATATRGKATSTRRMTRAKPNGEGAVDGPKPGTKQERKATKPRRQRPSRPGVRAKQGAGAGRATTTARARTSRASTGAGSPSGPKLRASKTNGQAAAATTKRAPRALARTSGNLRAANGRFVGRDPRTTLTPVPMTLTEERAILEQRRLQLVSLGLDDPAEAAVVDPDTEQSSASDTVVRGAPPMEIGLCAGCGFTLWVGARFCRRCGRVQEPPVSVGPASVGPMSAADGDEQKRARRGAAS